MKKSILTGILILSYLVSLTQPIPRKSIEDSVLGWMKVYNFKGAKTVMQVDDKIYSAAQLSLCDSLATWMQASYTPKGGLGDVVRKVSEKIGLYNKNDAALPQSYGAYANTYTELKYNASGKRVLLTSDGISWSIMANSPIGIPADAICTPTQYYFTLPSIQERGPGESEEVLNSLASHPNTKKYQVYVRRNSNGMFEKALFLYPENRFPFIKITKGEYLEQLAAAIERKYVSEKVEAAEKWYTEDSRALARKNAGDRYQKRLDALKNNRDKYKHELNDVAEIFTMQPDVLLENYPDVFLGTGGSRHRLPVYKIDPALVKGFKEDKPQWIMITWNGGISDPVGNHQHESIINNFNFEFLYNFCFYPQKVVGKSYKPLRLPDYKKPILLAKASDNSRKIKTDASVEFFEDFSTTADGQKPAGWKSTLSSAGTTAVVTHPVGLEGSWIELKGHNINASLLKKPLPHNFTMSYEIAVPENFAWGAKGLTMLLASESSAGSAASFVKLKLRPGSGGGNGEATVETKFSTPGYATGTKWYTAPGFSNNKKMNQVTVTIKKSDERLQVFIDKNKIADYEKAVPANQLFNALSFDCSGNSADSDKYFVSNLKITKD